MKPPLVIGLGNTLMGDDGAGCRAAERLARDPRLPSGIEVICGGTDLLRYADEIENRSRVILIDAIESEAEPGSMSLIEDGPEERREHAHHLSAVQQAELLRVMTGTPIRLFGISVASATLGTELSPAVADRLPAILDRILEEL
ncbi:MAG: hydrogenase maturation protease [Acidobacteriia bacterium]|nr:hydrogenase maturation protease [Terriglobia bacterium]